MTGKRAKVEWPFRILKRVFRFATSRYRGLKKNREWLPAAFAPVNLCRHRKRLARINQGLVPQVAWCAFPRPKSSSERRNRTPDPMGFCADEAKSRCGPL
jgi:hypothetical protein